MQMLAPSSAPYNTPPRHHHACSSSPCTPSSSQQVFTPHLLRSCWEKHFPVSDAHSHELFTSYFATFASRHLQSLIFCRVGNRHTREYAVDRACYTSVKTELEQLSSTPLSNVSPQRATRCLRVPLHSFDDFKQVRKRLQKEDEAERRQAIERRVLCTAHEQLSAIRARLSDQVTRVLVFDIEVRCSCCHGD